MSQQKDIHLEISKIKNLPPLPEASIRIITAVNDPDISVEDLAEVLSLSPVLAARLLGLANSAYFGRAGQISDLRIAIIQVLGLNLVKSLALSIVLNVELKTAECKMFDAGYFWSHALITALVAQKLAIQINQELIPPNIAYTSGLLLNIGLLAAITIYPQELSHIFSKTDRLTGSVSGEMQHTVGANQYEIGGILLERWKLPLVYQTVVKSFCFSGFEGEERGLIKLLELSHWVAAYIINDKMDEIPDFSELLNELSLSKEKFLKVVDGVVCKKDNILELAAVIGG
ncbi:MAG: HDOD domain-containing protein [Methylococcaceae bacterium]|nr:HDOD domain-containing protein [Methylococcaceae bacterium]